MFGTFESCIYSSFFLILLICERVCKYSLHSATLMAALLWLAAAAAATVGLFNCSTLRPSKYLGIQLPYSCPTSEPLHASMKAKGKPSGGKSRAATVRKW